MIITTKNLLDGRDGITVFLNNIETSKGLKEAKAAARSIIAEHIRRSTAKQTDEDYKVFIGATEWLANAEGLKEG